ncbi:reverse transcriptase domain-containing protein, partial [Tanacetum coccineum]
MLVGMLCSGPENSIILRVKGVFNVSLKGLLKSSSSISLPFTMRSSLGTSWQICALRFVLSLEGEFLLDRLDPPDLHLLWDLSFLVKVITDQPIRNILSRTEVSGKLAKYAVEIGTYKISFIPRNAVKGQVLADFLSDAPEGERKDEYFQSPEVPPEIDDTETWTMYTDGAAGLIGTGPSGVEYAYALRLTFASTNNEAEYEALLAGLRIARM